MKITNKRSRPSVVNTYTQGKFGQDYMVMHDTVESVPGPLLLIKADSVAEYMSVPGSFTLIEQGLHDPVKGYLLVTPGRPISLTWQTATGTEGVRVRDFMD